MALGDVTKQKGNYTDTQLLSLRYETIDVDEALLRLEKNTNEINKLTVFISCSTIVQVSFGAIFAILVSFSKTSSLILYVSSLLSVVGTFSEILLSFVYDVTRRVGNDLFSEISDTTQSGQIKQTPDKHREVLRSLKRWIRVSSMPLIPGPYGAAIYLLLNILTTIGVIVVALTHR